MDDRHRKGTFANIVYVARSQLPPRDQLFRRLFSEEKNQNDVVFIGESFLLGAQKFERKRELRR